MATLGTTYVSLAEKIKRQDPDGSIADIIEILAEYSPVFEDAITLEGNLPTGHLTTVRVGALPTPTWRRYYGGVIPTKSRTAQVTDTCGMSEAYIEIDRDLCNLNGNSAAFETSEVTAHLDGMVQDFHDVFFYGNTEATPNKFMGLLPRYDTISTDTTLSGYNIVDAGGTGSDNTSIALVTWGERATHLIYPKGSKGGVQHNRLGEVTAGDATNGYWQAIRHHCKLDVGLTVRDWRGNCRIANLDISDMAAGTVAIEDFLISAYFKTKKVTGKKVIYANEAVCVALAKRAKDKSNVFLSIGEWAGQEVTKFWGIPIRMADALLINETRVT